METNKSCVNVPLKPVYYWREVIAVTSENLQIVHYKSETKNFVVNCERILT